MKAITHQAIKLEEVATIVDEFLFTHYAQDDDVTLPRIWAWQCVVEYARDYGFTLIAEAVDRRGFSQADVADALGVSRQAVSERLLRGPRGGTPVAPASRPRQREQLPLT